MFLFDKKRIKSDISVIKWTFENFTIFRKNHVFCDFGLKISENFDLAFCLKKLSFLSKKCFLRAKKCQNITRTYFVMIFYKKIGIQTRAVTPKWKFITIENQVLRFALNGHFCIKLQYTCIYPTARYNKKE